MNDELMWQQAGLKDLLFCVAYFHILKKYNCLHV